MGRGDEGSTYEPTGAGRHAPGRGGDQDGCGERDLFFN